jgi:hypothetical protein
VKGTNVLTLNHATMREALQLWFNTVFTGAKANVTNIQQKNAQFASSEFEVTIVVEEEPTAQAPIHGPGHAR